MNDKFQKPIIRTGKKIISDFLIKNGIKNIKFIDFYREQLEELFLLRNPKYRFDKKYEEGFNDFIKLHKKGKASLDNCGKWVFFPWLDMAVHILDEYEFFEMRTGRNRNLISKEEQKIFYESTVALAGLSVGSHAAATIVMNGGAKNFKIADSDTLSGSNLNRVRTGVQNIGEKKAHIVARQLYELNPYINLQIYDKGVEDGNIYTFLKGSSVVIEEVDNPYFKFKIRELAKEMRLPVVMATDNGDNIFVDIERYDLDPKLEIFNGKVRDISSSDLKTLDPRLLPKVAAKIAGAEIATTRMQQSVLEVGKTLYSWPQLGTAANMCGTVLAFLARNIVNGQRNFKSGRYEVNLEGILDCDYKKKGPARAKQTKQFLKKIGL